MTTKRTRVSQIKGILSLQKRRSRLASQLAALDQQIEAKLEVELSKASSESAQPRSAAPRPAQVVSKGKSATRSTSASTRGPKGVLKEQILGLLGDAGASGLPVREIAEKLDTKPANIHTWFSTNIKRIPGLKKVKAGHFALSGGKASKASAAKPKAAASKATASKAATPKASKAKAATKSAPKTAGRTAAPRTKAKATVATTAKKPTAARSSRKTAAKPAATRKSPARTKSADEDFVPAKRGELKANVLAELKKAGAEGVTVKDLADKVGTRYKNLYIWFVTTGKRVPGIEKVGPARYRLTSAKA